MPHVRFRTLYITPGMAAQADEIVDLPPDQAAYLVGSGNASYVDEPTIVEPHEPEPDDDDQVDDEPDSPSRSSSKRNWVAYAVSVGMDPADAEAFTRDELAERYLD